MAKTMTTQKIVTPSAESIAASARAAQKRGLPPVHLWNPPHCGDLDMRIARDGTWFYMGTPIGRPELVKLFSTILRKDGDDYVLVTPVEKVGIEVEDAPFVAVEMNAIGEGDDQVLTFRTNVGDLVECGPDNPLRFDIIGDTDQLKPYVLVRGRLEALLARPVMYELISHGENVEVDGQEMFVLRSNGATFPIMPSQELAELSA